MVSVGDKVELVEELDALTYGSLSLKKGDKLKVGAGNIDVVKKLADDGKLKKYEKKTKKKTKKKSKSKSSAEGVMPDGKKEKGKGK